MPKIIRYQTFESMLQTLHLKENSWAAFNAQHFIFDSGCG